MRRHDASVRNSDRGQCYRNTNDCQLVYCSTVRLEVCSLLDSAGSSGRLRRRSGRRNDWASALPAHMARRYDGKDRWPAVPPRGSVPPGQSPPPLAAAGRRWPSPAATTGVAAGFLAARVISLTLKLLFLQVLFV